MAGFDVVPTVPLLFADDLDEAAMPIRGYAALYVGGMGSREQNFYNALARRMGYEAEAEQVQNLYLDKQYLEAAMAIPRGLHRRHQPDRPVRAGARPPARVRRGGRDDAHGLAVRARPGRPGRGPCAGPRRPWPPRASPSRARRVSQPPLSGPPTPSPVPPVLPARTSEEIRTVSDLGYVDAVLLGVVEGLTEFLPVSSTGHLTAVEGLRGLDVDDPAVTAYTAIIQFGAHRGDVPVLPLRHRPAGRGLGRRRAVAGAPRRRLPLRLVRGGGLGADRRHCGPREAADHRAAAQPVGGGGRADPVERGHLVG
jgi:hypothetical protein